MEPDQQLRNLKDFLLVYNRMTEICFQRCTSNFNYRNLTMDEERCVDSCAGKLIRSNHRLMGTYVQLMPRMVQRRMEEMESKAAENAKAAEAAMSAPAELAATDGLPAAQTPITPSPSVPPLLSPAVTEVGPLKTSAAHGQATDELVVSTPPPGLGEAIMRPQVHGSGLDAAAATLLPPAVETANLSQAANGQSYTPVLPIDTQTPIASAQIESGSSVPISDQPVFTPSKPVTISEQ